MEFELFALTKHPQRPMIRLLHGIMQDAQLTKYAVYTTIDGARRCRLPRYVDLVQLQQLS